MIAQAVGDRRLEGYSLSCLACAYVRQGALAQATSVFTTAVALFREVGDRAGEAECQWHYGLALSEQGEPEGALPMLRAALAYQTEIGHFKLADHVALVAQLEAEQTLCSARLKSEMPD